jgi:hypothetical protein
MIKKAEAILQVKLPQSYIDLMTFCNGGRLRKNTFPTSEPTNYSSDHIAVHDLYGIGGSFAVEDEGVYMINEWEYPVPAVCISCIDGHTAILLDYRDLQPNQEPPVIYYGTESEKGSTWLAPNFQTFIDGLIYDCSNYEIGMTRPPNVKAFEHKLQELGRYSKDEPLGWYTVHLPNLPGYEYRNARLHISHNFFSDGSGIQYPEFPDCYWIASLDIEDNHASHFLAIFEQVMQQVGCQCVVIHKPHRWPSGPVFGNLEAD